MYSNWETPTKAQLGAGYLIGVGVALLVSLLAYLWFSLESQFYIVIGLSMAATLFGTIVYIGYLFLDVELADILVWNVAMWSSFGLGIATVLSLIYGIAARFLPDTALVPSLFVLVIAAGGIVGTLLGVVIGLREQQKRIRKVSERNRVLNRVLRHNIRNSVNIVLAHLSDLKGNTNGNGQEEASLIAIERASQEILELSDSARQIDEIRDEETSGPVDIPTLVEQYVNSARETYPEAEITTDLPEKTMTAGDPLLRAALDNLVENAIEHCDDDPLVRIDVDDDPSDDAVVIRVEDNGPGIPELERRALEQGSEKSIDHGSGLGLWLVKWIVDHYGGELRIFRNDPDGSVVAMRLPNRNAADNLSIEA